MRFRLRKALSYSLFAVTGVLFITFVHRRGDDVTSGYRLAGGRAHRPRSRDVIDPTASRDGDRRRPSLWRPDPDGHDDRILDQMRHVPALYRSDAPLKFIFAPGGVWGTPMGRAKFVEQRCPVDRCALTAHRPPGAAAVLIQNSLDGATLRKRRGQIWILWLLESPINTVDLSWLRGKVNWTASYRADSTIVTPYEKFVPRANVTRPPRHPDKDYAEGKTRQVAWFVSNCNAANQRLEYARQLRRYVSVDVYGACGSRRCSRDSAGKQCDLMLKRHYKFYLSFENSNCEYYITEKLFWNALFNDVVPVVMGGRKSDYERAAPPHSFIHVEDFSSTRHLADYLLKLDRDDRLYNEYFLWKNTGSFINTKFWCRLCAMLHDVNKPVTWYDDVERWWRHNGSCTRHRWDKEDDIITDWRPAMIRK